MAAVSEKPYVVLVVGRPASGKSTISAEIAGRWRLPVLAKDSVKELLFDTLGTGDREWSMSLGRASFALLDYVVELQLRTGVPFLVDASYNPGYENAKFQAWQRRYGFTAVQVHCSASPDELVRRFIQRAHDGTRHPGHTDHRWVDDFRRSLTEERNEVLALDGPVLTYDSGRPGASTEVLRRLTEILPLPIPPRPRARCAAPPPAR